MEKTGLKCNTDWQWTEKKKSAEAAVECHAVGAVSTTAEYDFSIRMEKEAGVTMDRCKNEIIS